MSPAVRRLGATLLAAGACCSGVLTALAIASPDARLASSKPAAHHKSRHRCTTHKGKGHRTSHPIKRCPAKHRPAAKHTTGATTPTGTSTTSTGTLPVSSTGTGSTAPPLSGGETPITPKPPEVPRVQVTAVEYKYTLSRTTVPAGKIILEFDNKGQDEHNLNVLDGGGELSSSFTNQQPGAVSEEAIDLKPGSYMLFCSLPEHEAKGMKATLVVE